MIGYRSFNQQQHSNGVAQMYSGSAKVERVRGATNGVPSLDSLREMASGKDVSMLVKQYYQELLDLEDPEVLEILNLGFRNEAVHWLRMADERSLHIGKFPKERRIREARTLAEKAGLSLTQLAREENLLHVLS